MNAPNPSTPSFAGAPSFADVTHDQVVAQARALVPALRSRAAQAEGAKGFIGNANDATAHWFGAPKGYGTMPHALIGYAGSTVRAAEMFHETFPD